MEPEPTPGGALEAALLRSLWDAEPDALSARALHDLVGTGRGVVYTTVAKVLDRLVAKGLVRRTRQGRRYLFRASVTRETTQRAMLRASLDHIFGAGWAGPAARPAAAHLVGALEDVSPALLDELSAALDARRGRPAGGDGGASRGGESPPPRGADEAGEAGEAGDGT